MATIIFDFDGTIANSLPIIMDILHELTHRPAVNRAEIKHLRQLPVYDLARELRISRWRVPYMLWRGRKIMKSRIGEIKIFEDMNEVIGQLHAKKHHLYIMSSNDTLAIKLFLKQHKLDKYFIHVYGNVGLFAKARKLKRIIRQDNINRDECYYIGDEVRDIEAGKSAGVQQIAVTWGYNDEHALKFYGPTYVINSPKQLLSEIKS